MKWAPKFSSSVHEIGLLGYVSSNGSILIYSLPIIGNEAMSKSNSLNKSINSINLDPKIIITISEEIILNTFDWLNNNKCDQIIAGDQLGNIYLIDIKEHNNSFEVVKYYYQAHHSHITDI